MAVAASYPVRPQSRPAWRLSGSSLISPRDLPKHAALNILLIEDDKKMAAHLELEFKDLGHKIKHVESGEAALELAESGSFNALIIDRMLPDLDGLSLLKMLRRKGYQVPAIFLTTMTGIGDRVEGLEAGADDYMVKPFAFEELMARLFAITRRQSSDQSRTKIKIGDLEIDLLKHAVVRAGIDIDLLPQEFRILAFLAQNDGRIVTRAMLLEHVWGFHFDPKTSVVETHISRLRAKIDKGCATELLKTVRGAGYSLRAD